MKPDCFGGLFFHLYGLKCESPAIDLYRCAGEGRIDPHVTEVYADAGRGIEIYEFITSTRNFLDKDTSAVKTQPCAPALVAECRIGEFLGEIYHRIVGIWALAPLWSVGLFIILVSGNVWLSVGHIGASVAGLPSQ